MDPLEKLKALKDKAASKQAEQSKASLEKLKALKGPQSKSSASDAPALRISGGLNGWTPSVSVEVNGVPDFLKSLGTGFVDAATLGQLPGIAAVNEQLPTLDPLSKLMATAVNTGMGATGNQIIDPSKYRDAMDAVEAASPTGNFLGKAAGYVVPGIGEAKAVKALGESIPTVGKMLSSWLGRAGLGAGGGAVQTGLESAARGNNPLLDMAYGALGGGVGQAVLGDLIPNVVRGVAESDFAQTGADFLRQTIQKARTTAANPQSLIDEVASAGKGALVADAPSVSSAVPQVLHGGPYSANADALKGPLLSRVGEAPGQAAGTDLLSQFGNMVETSVPQFSHQFARPAFFTSPGVRYSGLKTPKQLRAVTKDRAKAASPEYTRILSAHDNTFTSLADAKKWVTQVMAPEGVAALSSTVRKAYDVALKELNTLAGVTKKSAGGPLTPTQLRAAITTFREKADKLTFGMPSGTASLVRGRLAGAAHAIEVNVLDKLPGYAKLNEAHKEAADYVTAHDLGYNMSKMKPDELSTLPEQLNGMPDSQYAGFLEGMARDLSDKLKPGAISELLIKRSPGKVATALAGSDALRETIQKALPTATADELLSAAQAAVAQMRTAKLGLSGSAAKEVARDSKQHADNFYNRGVMLAFLTRVFTSARGIKPFQPSAAALGGSVRREISQHELGPKTTKAIAEALATSGSGVSDVANQIFGGALKQSGDKSVLDNLTSFMSPLRTGVASTLGAQGTQSIMDFLTHPSGARQ